VGFSPCGGAMDTIPSRFHFHILKTTPNIADPKINHAEFTL
jgi:hypothetical protein